MSDYKFKLGLALAREQELIKRAEELERVAGEAVKAFFDDYQRLEKMHSLSEALGRA